jgi:hypothetical protein
MASNKILIIYQEAVNATVWKPISVWYISLWFLWLGLLVVGAVVNYNCKKCFDSLLSNVLCRLVYVKAKKKKNILWLPVFWLSDGFLSTCFWKKKNIKHGFSLPYGKNSKTQIYIHPAKKNKNKIWALI